MATETQTQEKVVTVEDQQKAVTQQLEMIKTAIAKREAAKEAVDTSFETLKAMKKAHKRLVEHLDSAEEELKVISENV